MLWPMLLFPDLYGSILLHKPEAEPDELGRAWLNLIIISDYLELHPGGTLDYAEHMVGHYRGIRSRAEVYEEVSRDILRGSGSLN